ncbi:MAG: 4Fe-4S binding protein [Thermoplasmatota archaeon]
MQEKFQGRNIRPYRLIFQLLAAVFLLGQLWGLPPFGTYPILNRIFLPNASCRYINDAPTSCFYYQVQDGLTNGYGDMYINVIIMLLVVVVLVLILGRTWCAWLCPFGLVQEGVTKLRTLLNIPPLRLNWKTRTILRRIKYAFMFFTVILSLPIGISSLGISSCQSTLALPFCQICPAKGFFTVFQQVFGLEPWGTVLPILAILSLLIFLISSFFVRMAFCRVCPMGGFMALFSKRSLTYLHKDPEKCTKCRVCLRVCPVDHDRVYEDMEHLDVAGEDCTLCGRCVEMCPEEGCLSINFGPARLVRSRSPRPIGSVALVKRILGRSPVYRSEDKRERRKKGR